MKNVLAKDWMAKAVLRAPDLDEDQRIAALFDVFVNGLVGASVIINKGGTWASIMGESMGRRIALGASVAETKAGGKFGKLGKMSGSRRRKPAAEPAPEKTTKGAKPKVIKNTKDSKEF